MQDIDRIWQEAEKILEIVNQKFAENDKDLPSHQYLAVGDQGGTVHDKEQVTVSFGTTDEGLPGNNTPYLLPCGQPFRGTFSVEIVRCTPTGANTGARGYTPPTSDDLTTHAKVVMEDAAILTQVADAIGEYEANYTKTTAYNIAVGADSGGMQPIILNINTVVVGR